jgi:SP family myo-inositol transporter-like MFS transporter 13
VAILELALYIISFDPGMGTLSWVINPEIYPLRYKRTGGGLVATSSWVFKSILAQTFFNMNVTISTFMSFLFFGAISVTVVCFVLTVMAETKGLSH